MTNATGARMSSSARGIGRSVLLRGRRRDLGRRRPCAHRLAEHPAVVPALLASVAAVLTSVHAAIDAVRDDGGGSDDGRGPRDRPADYASSPDTGWPKRHLRLLP